MGGLCLLEKLHREGSAPAACAAGLFTLHLNHKTKSKFFFIVAEFNWIQLSRWVRPPIWCSLPGQICYTTPDNITFISWDYIVYTLDCYTRHISVYSRLYSGHSKQCSRNFRLHSVHSKLYSELSSLFTVCQSLNRFLLGNYPHWFPRPFELVLQPKGFPGHAQI